MLPIAERYARRNQARQLALELLARHGLHDWHFAYNRRKQCLGLCRYSLKTIELSSYFVDRNDPAAILDTILHEIAHALVGPAHGHDAVWRAKCREIGAVPRRCGVAEMPRGRWQARCDACGQEYSRHRKPKHLQGWFCRRCGAERGKLVWRATP
jgi:predicted SprT family Zn-dependent metalloprotease